MTDDQIMVLFQECAGDPKKFARTLLSASIADTAIPMTIEQFRANMEEAYALGVADTAGAKPVGYVMKHRSGPDVGFAWKHDDTNFSSDWVRHPVVYASPPTPSVAEPSEGKPVVCSCPSDECDVRTLGLTGSYYLRKCADMRATKSGDGHAE